MVGLPFALMESFALFVRSFIPYTLQDISECICARALIFDRLHHEKPI